MFANAITAARQGNQFTTVEAARRAGLMACEWVKLESGESIPDGDLPLLKNIADGLEVSYITLSFLAAVSRFNRDQLDHTSA
jgi:transcriptional regulator with XRE-family HTH domain